MIPKSVLTIMVALVLGCTEKSVTGDGFSICTAGERQQCSCAEGPGVQFCTEFGLQWSECFCGQSTKGLTEAVGKSSKTESVKQASKLGVVWYSDDPYVAERLGLMY